MHSTPHALLVIRLSPGQACQVAKECKGPYRTAKKAIMDVFVQWRLLPCNHPFDDSLYYADVLDVMYLIDKKYESRSYNLDSALRSLVYENRLKAIGDGSYVIHPAHAPVALPGSMYNRVKAKINAQEKLKKLRQNNHFVYYIQWENDPHHIKIGYSTSVVDRVASFLTSSPHKLEVLRVAMAESQEDEMRLHFQFKQYRVAGEWFRYEKELRKHVSMLDADYALGLGLDRHPRVLVHCF